MKAEKKNATPSERAEQVWNELATDDARVEFASAWERLVDARLTELAVSIRNPSIPAGWFRTNWIARGAGVMGGYAVATRGRTGG
jgi:hypothetical protein